MASGKATPLDLDEPLNSLQQVIQQQPHAEGWVPLIGKGRPNMKGHARLVCRNASHLLHSIADRAGIPIARTFRTLLWSRPATPDTSPPYVKVEIYFTRSKVPFVVDYSNLPPPHAWCCFSSKESPTSPPPAAKIQVSKRPFPFKSGQEITLAVFEKDRVSSRRPKQSWQQERAALADDTLGFAYFKGPVLSTFPQYDQRLHRYTFVDTCVFQVERQLKVTDKRYDERSEGLVGSQVFEVHVPALRMRNTALVLKHPPLTTSQIVNVQRCIANVMGRLMGEPVSEGGQWLPYSWTAEDFSSYTIQWRHFTLIGFTSQTLPPGSGMLVHTVFRTRLHLYGFAPVAQDSLGMLGSRTVHAPTVHLSDSPPDKAHIQRARQELKYKMLEDRRAWREFFESHTYKGTGERQGEEVFVEALSASDGSAGLGTLVLSVRRARAIGGIALEPKRFQLTIPVLVNASGTPLSANLRLKLAGKDPPERARDRHYARRV